jgi:hypothetical protein
MQPHMPPLRINFWTKTGLALLLVILGDFTIYGQFVRSSLKPPADLMRDHGLSPCRRL